MTASTSLRDNRYANQHDPIYHSLDLVPNWLVYGHLTWPDWGQGSEAKRVKQFHTLIRNTARRFAGRRDLHSVGWFLRQEGNSKDKLYHFHFSMTDDKFSNTTPEVVCRYMTKQWEKIAKTRCQFEPWNPEEGPRAVWYNTKYEPYKLRHSAYFGGDVCHWRMSPLLASRIQQIATRPNPMRTPPKIVHTANSLSSAYNFNLVTDRLPEGTFTVGGTIYPKSQFAEVLEYWFDDEPLPPSNWRPLTQIPQGVLQGV